MKKKKGGKCKPMNRAKKAPVKEEINPFELKINRQRHSVLGRKLKNDKGKPGVSRSKAMKRRAEIFQKSSTLLKKSNVFIDKRIGEYDNELSKEDAILERMARARKKRYKKDIFNLNDGETLTHFGQPLDAIEKFDDPENDSDDDDDDTLMNADYVDKVHFGGFLTKKSDDGNAEKSHKETIGDLILESKKRKEEKKTEREETEDLTKKLDEEWKSIHAIMSEIKRKDGEDSACRDPYDIAVRELKFEPRAVVANPLKSEEELKKAELLKMKKLEEERINRMKGDSNMRAKEEQLSADSIYDGLEIEEDIHLDEAAEDPQSQDLGESDHSESDDDNEKSEVDLDIADFSSEEEDNNQREDVVNKVSSEANVIDLIEMPKTIDQFVEMMSGKSAQEVSSVVQRIIKKYHPSCDAEGKKKLDLFFCILLKFITRIVRKCDLDYLDSLVPLLFSLTQINGLKTGQIFKKFLAKKVSDYKKAKENSADFPSLDILVTLKLCSILYPTSDFCHPIVTPALLLMSDILCPPFKITFRNILSRLFVSCLFFEYVMFSKRLAVEAIDFLRMIIRMASFDPSVKDGNSKKLSKAKDLLSVKSTVEAQPESISLQLLHQDFVLEKEPIGLKISIIFCAVSQLHKFAEIYTDLPSFQEIFSETEMLCDRLPIHFYPTGLSASIKSLKDFLCSHKQARTFLTFPKKKPKMLKMFEPSFEMDESDKNMSLGKKMKLSKKLSQKIRKEEKSILREMRRDAQFVARKQIQEKMEADKERKRKVKQIYHELSMQEGEYKKYMKSNK